MISPKWVGHYRVQEVISNKTYKLETLDGDLIPRTWNAVNLHFYFS